MEYDAGLWACHSKVTFPQNKGRATKKEKGSPQIREVYLQSLNQHSEEVKWEVEEMLKVLDVFRRHRKKKKAECKSVKSISRISIHRLSGEGGVLEDKRTD